jgi:hypothetical protein
MAVIVETPCVAARAEQVDGQGEVAEAGQPVGVTAHDVVEAEDLVDHHHGRPRAGAHWTGQVATKRLGPVAVSGEIGEVDVGHGWASCGVEAGNA